MIRSQAGAAMLGEKQPPAFQRGGYVRGWLFALFFGVALLSAALNVYLLRHPFVIVVESSDDDDDGSTSAVSKFGNGQVCSDTNGLCVPFMSA